MNHGNVGMIFWEKEEKVMTLDSMRIGMDKAKIIVDRSIADAEDLLWERPLWTESAHRFKMKINVLEDCMSFPKRESVFCHQSTNSTHVELGEQDCHLDARITAREEDETRRQLLVQLSG
jgi:hypothetical protein